MESPQENDPQSRERGLNRLRAICRRPALWILLSLIFLLLYCWPFLLTTSGWTGRVRYVYLFAVWFLNVAAITIVSISLPPFRQGGSRRD